MQIQHRIFTILWRTQWGPDSAVMIHGKSKVMPLYGAVSSVLYDLSAVLFSSRCASFSHIFLDLAKFFHSRSRQEAHTISRNWIQRIFAVVYYYSRWEGRDILQSFQLSSTQSYSRLILTTQLSHSRAIGYLKYRKISQNSSTRYLNTLEQYSTHHTLPEWNERARIQ